MVCTEDTALAESAGLPQETQDTYNFTNIRYAQPPVGDLRFAAPIAPTGRNTTIEDGSTGRICAQGNPAWFGIAEQFLVKYFSGQPFDYNSTAAAVNASLASIPPSVDPRTTEDCLFLDVVAPKTIFDAKGNGTGAPVLVWIYGGGYTAGNKNDGFNPSGLIRSSNNGLVFVALNYRLGAFGWLSGPTFQGSGGIANAGLYDQRLALEWVQENIHLFGGDPNRVTVMGESAGGGSIQHQITAYAGLKNVSFQQAIPQSPGFLPTPNDVTQENVYTQFLSMLGASSLAEARALPSETVIQANAMQILQSQPYGTFTYGPVVDGIFVPALPGKLLLQGNFAKDVNVMVGHNTNEGPLFTDPRINSNAALISNLQTNFPSISPGALLYLTGTLYPEDYSGTTLPYTTPFARAAFIETEAIFTCNTYYLDTAYGNKTYAYQFSVPPAYHGEDIPFTFYNGGGQSGSIPFPQVAVALQKYITDFVINGSPGGNGTAGLPYFPMWTGAANEQDLNATMITTMRDPTANERCQWWQKALYF
ncbi:MAG: hypothetical protein Q9227_008091 [Pyrenula ochraceoflavens]